MSGQPERPPARPLPECLKKHGIKGVRSNVPPGGAVRLPKGLLMTYFGEELMAAASGRGEEEAGDG